MKRLMVIAAVLALLGLGLGVLHAYEQSRTYNRSIELVWDEAVKAVRDADLVLVDSKRSEHWLSMRSKSKLSAKRGLHIFLKLTRASEGNTVMTVVTVRPEDPSKAEKTAKHITRYLIALDKRMN
jgi:hypothetical protein